MANRFIPDCDAAGPNAQWIDAPELPDDLLVRTVDGHKVVPDKTVAWQLETYRNIASYLSPMAITFSAETPLPTGWEELWAQSYGLYTTFVEEHDELPLKGGPAKEDTTYGASGLEHAAVAGTAVTKAFAEVIPRVVFRESFNDPNAQLADLMRGSIGFLIGLRGLDKDTDGDITYALTHPKPKFKDSADSVEKYQGLRFHDKWFRRIGHGIGLKPEKVTHMRNDKGRPVKLRVEPGSVLFGCPARKQIVQLVLAMTDRAEQAELFAKTYYAERSAYGY